MSQFFLNMTSQELMFLNNSMPFIMIFAFLLGIVGLCITAQHGGEHIGFSMAGLAFTLIGLAFINNHFQQKIEVYAKEQLVDFKIEINDQGFELHKKAVTNESQINQISVYQEPTYHQVGNINCHELNMKNCLEEVKNNIKRL